MTELLTKTRFMISVLDLFHKEKLLYMQSILEEVNSSPDPELRFFKAELRRLAMFEEKFLRLMENYPQDISDIQQLHPEKLIKILVGNVDY